MVKQSGSIGRAFIIRDDCSSRNEDFPPRLFWVVSLRAMQIIALAGKTKNASQWQ